VIRTDIVQLNSVVSVVLGDVLYIEEINVYNKLYFIVLGVFVGLCINPLNYQLNRICHFLALLGAHLILHVSRFIIHICKVSITWNSQTLFTALTKRHLCAQPRGMRTGSIQLLALPVWSCNTFRDLLVYYLQLFKEKQHLQVIQTLHTVSTETHSFIVPEWDEYCLPLFDAL
jgi:hypothetical protein